MNPADATIPSERRRTISVWLISTLYSAVPFLCAVRLVVNHFGAIPQVAQSHPYFHSLGVVDLTIGLVLAATEVAGASLLWLLRRQALHFFIAATVLHVLNFWWHSLIRGWMGVIQPMAPVMTVPVVVSTALGSMVLVAISVYTWRLTRAGVLK